MILLPLPLQSLDPLFRSCPLCCSRELPFLFQLCCRLLIFSNSFFGLLSPRKVICKLLWCYILGCELLIFELEALCRTQSFFLDFELFGFAMHGIKLRLQLAGIRKRIEEKFDALAFLSMDLQDGIPVCCNSWIVAYPPSLISSWSQFPVQIPDKIQATCHDYR